MAAVVSNDLFDETKLLLNADCDGDELVLLLKLFARRLIFLRLSFWLFDDENADLFDEEEDEEDDDVLSNILDTLKFWLFLLLKLLLLLLLLDVVLLLLLLLLLLFGDDVIDELVDVDNEPNDNWEWADEDEDIMAEGECCFNNWDLLLLSILLFGLLLISLVE